MTPQSKQARIIIICAESEAAAESVENSKEISTNPVATWIGNN